MVSFGFDESTTLQARNPSPSLALGAACCSHGCSPRQGGGGALAGAREGEAAGGRRARGEARLAGAMRSAIRGAQSGARIPRRTRPDPHARPLLCGRRRRQLFCSRGAPAAEGAEARGGRGGVCTCRTGSGRSRRSDRKAGRSPRQVASAGAGAVLSLHRCWLARSRCRLARCRLAPAPALKGPPPPSSSASAPLVARGRSVRQLPFPAPHSLIPAALPAAAP